jgi:hypothetical protein
LSVHGRIWLAGVAVLLVAGCGREAEPVAVPAAEPVPVQMTAASAGGACRLLDFVVIQKHAGTRFDIAAASQRGDTHTCVVRAEKAVLPELTLTVTDTSMDVPTFDADVLPDGARKVSKLGQVGYRRTAAASGRDGPAAEVGWLAAEGRLATLRYICPHGSARSAADAVADKLVNLARAVDTRAL